jgi:hypothetical protein
VGAGVNLPSDSLSTVLNFLISFFLLDTTITRGAKSVFVRVPRGMAALLLSYRKRAAFYIAAALHAAIFDAHSNIRFSH